MNNGAPGASSPERSAAPAISWPQFGLFLSFAGKLFIQLSCLAGVNALVYLNLLMGWSELSTVLCHRHLGTPKLLLPA